MEWMITALGLMNAYKQDWCVDCMACVMKVTILKTSKVSIWVLEDKPTSMRLDLKTYI